MIANGNLKRLHRSKIANVLLSLPNEKNGNHSLEVKTPEQNQS